MNSKKVGVITYHGAYNYGSALQALATQDVIESLGYQVDILNYRMKSQRQYYSMYRITNGWKKLLSDAAQLPVHKKRMQRQEKFETFFEKYLNLTTEFSRPREMEQLKDDYRIVVSGSDQIWNKHSNELENVDWSFMLPYFLAGMNCVKVSYASSISNMTDEDLERIKPLLEDFSQIAMREESSAKRISDLLEKEITSVIDPTFMHCKEEWIEKFDLKRKRQEPYILLYSLGGRKNSKALVEDAVKFAKAKKQKLQVVTPFAYYSSSDIVENHSEYGPVEFLNSIYNAAAIITDSFHGTALASNFNKNFFSICAKGGSEFRKTELLKSIGLETQIVSDIADIYEIYEKVPDYRKANERMDAQREKSLKYLKDALQ